MKRRTILNSLAILILSASSFSQTLTDAQVMAAIDRALSGKRHQIGLTLNDVQTVVISHFACTTCGTTGYTIFVYPPESWIELKAVQARREMLPFGLEDVTPEMRLPYIHILASPSKPEYLNANGMGMASSVHRVVLSSTDRSDVIQPLSESQAQVESNSALRSFTQSSAGAVFSMEDVVRLRSEDPKREFFIVVVGDKQNKYFKVKTRFFNQLFGRDSDSEYAGLKSTPPAVVATKKPAPAPENVTASTHAESIPAPSTTKPITSVSTKPNPKTPTPASTKAHAPAPAGTGRNSAPPSNDAYRHDSVLIADWWNLREPGSADPKPLANGPLGTDGKGSIGGWCDEQPRIRHDGVRIDRIAPGGPAEQAGLQIGDDILALDGIYLFTEEELMNNVRQYQPGAKVSLRYRRRSTIYDGFVIMGAEEIQKAAVK